MGNSQNKELEINPTGDSENKELEIEFEPNLTFTAFGKNFVLSLLEEFPDERESEQNYTKENNPANFIPNWCYILVSDDWVRSKNETIWSPQGSGFFHSYPSKGTPTIFRWKNNELKKFNKLPWLSKIKTEHFTIKFHQGSLFIYRESVIVYCIPDPEAEELEGVTISDRYPFTFDPVRPDTALQLVKNYQETGVKLIRYNAKVEKLMEGPEIKFYMGQGKFIHPDLSGLVFFIQGENLSVFNSDLTEMENVPLRGLFGKELFQIYMYTVNEVAILNVLKKKQFSSGLNEYYKYHSSRNRYYEILPAE